MMHIEWEDHARDVSVDVYDAATALEELQPDDETIYGSHALALSSGGGGAFATCGSPADIVALALRIITATPINDAIRANAIRALGGTP